MDWHTYLASQGAHTDEQGQVSFPTAAADTALVPLQQFGLIRFSGEETLAFLHGQVSSDLKKMPADGCQYSSYSTPKGRMLASFLVLREADDILLMLPRALQAGVQKRLSMYVLRSKTRASDASDERVLLGLNGPQATAIALAVFGSAPAEAMQTIKLAGGLLARLGQDRLLLCLTLDAAMAAWPALLAAGAQPSGTAAWTLSDIRAGIPWILPETQEAFVAQMANMELIGAVSFKKGCYPGQEIVARTQYLGKLKRRTFRVSATAPMQAGQAVYSPEMNGQASGQVALAAPAGEGLWEALVVVQMASVEHGVHLDSPEGPLLTFLPLPYPVHE
ncbi:folate-binding protein YgfZ [Chitinimonas prasina]|uniref:Folate-binding protein YgfZ n=1 Tax=Chitinimonas prasina TaxID=1434937 RepID=A0ABQ5YNJ4_9NEIS|nr:folate-binding protein [Chitinimonas prasina]GLR15327.1 folate-binding protein YgfZ [Chitinimonas prasina]